MDGIYVCTYVRSQYIGAYISAAYMYSVPLYCRGICILFAYVNMAPTQLHTPCCSLPVYLLPAYLFTFVFSSPISLAPTSPASVSVCLCVWIFSSVWNVTEILMPKFLFALSVCPSIFVSFICIPCLVKTGRGWWAKGGGRGKEGQ